MTLQCGLVTCIHAVFEERDARTNKQRKSKSGQKAQWSQICLSVGAVALLSEKHCIIIAHDNEATPSSPTPTPSLR